MIDQFLEWFCDCLRNLGCLFFDMLEQSLKILLDVLAWIIVIVLIILISPIWIPFLIFWWFFVRNKEVESDTD